MEVNDITPLQQMLSSCSGALITSLLVTPLDVVKIRLQAQTNNSSQKCFLYCNGLMDHLCLCVNGNGKDKWYKRPGHFTGTFDAMMKISRYEGITSLWSGLSPTLMMAVPATVIYFTSYDQLKSRMQKKFGNYYLIPAVAGGAARIGTVTIISPLELIRTKMQSKPLSYKETSAVVRSSIKQSGFRSLWMGWMPTLLRDVPFSMIYWFSYEIFKQQIPVDNLFLKSLSCGFLAGTLSTILTNPFDVVKTRKQIEIGQRGLKVSSVATDSTISVMKNVIHENGTKGLFAGLIPRVCKIGPACAIMISSYEFGKRFFHDFNDLSKLERKNYSEKNNQIVDRS